MDFNIYCDESCHLEKDQESVMVLGAVWCPTEKVREISIRLREIKQKNSTSKKFEVKWTKVCASKVELYLDYMDYFFDDNDLHFRALIAPKKNLRHNYFGQTHDEWYYKMYFNMLKVIFSPDSRYNVYLDVKDTRGSAKVAMLRDVLCNNMYDFSRSIIAKMQIIRSEESEIMQLADLLTGVISYVNRGKSSNKGKIALVDRMRSRSHYTLTRSTLFRENKVNLFSWHPSDINSD